MDPIWWLVIGAVALLAGPKLLKTGLANTIFALNKKSQRNKASTKNRQDYKKAKKNAKEMVKESRMSTQINQSMTRIQDILFKNIRTKQTEKIRVNEIAKFDDNKDVLLKGRLHIVDPMGKRTVQDIYLFQPRLFSAQSQIGPKLNKFGNMSDKYTYLCRHTGTPDALSGYVPKREIFSGMRFDYVTNGAHSFLERNPIYSDLSANDLKTISALEQYIYIDIPKDDSGNFIPVNLNDLNQLKEFQNYVKRHYMNFKKNGVRPEEYFGKEFEKAQRSLAKHIEEYEPTYIPTASKVQVEAPAVKVESSKKATTSINDYYKRFDYYLDPKFGEKYNSYNRGYGPKHPPHPHHRR